MAADKALTPLERFLNLFTEVRSGEATSALLLALNIFLILTAYYVLKPVREALILAGGGAEVKSYAAAGQALLLLGAVPLYGWLASRVPRRVLINGVTLFFAGCLLVFYGLAQLQVPLGVVFFLWVGIFNLMVPAQFWALANDLYTPEAGKRLFVIVAFGASCGAVAGSYLDSLLIGPVGVYQLMLVAAGILAVSLILTNGVERREQARKAQIEHSSGAQQAGEDEPLKEGGAFALVFRSRYLLLIALLMLVLNWVNTTGEYILGRTVLAAAEEAVAYGTARGLSEEEYIGEFYAEFFTVVNLVGLLLQLFVVSRVLKYLGVGTAIMILPLIALGGYLIAAFYPVLAMVRWAKTAENATDYSVQNTVRQVLFLPTTREQKYKAKQAIDTFFVRAGDVLSAVVVFAGTTWLAFSAQSFALFNVALVIIWLILAILIGRHHKRLTASRTP
jgi:AAA family ATP:ADP antiporter